MRFLLIDKILILEPGHAITGIKNASMSEDFFTHHFPQYPIMPGMLILEGMTQLARWLIIHDSEFITSGVLSSVRLAKFRSFAVPGDQIHLQVSQVEREDQHIHFRGKAQVGDTPKVTAEFTLQEMPLAQLDDPADARRLFEVLWQNGDEGRRR